MKKLMREWLRQVDDLAVPGIQPIDGAYIEPSEDDDEPIVDDNPIEDDETPADDPAPEPTKPDLSDDDLLALVKSRGLSIQAPEPVPDPTPKLSIAERVEAQREADLENDDFKPDSYYTAMAVELARQETESEIAPLRAEIERMRFASQSAAIEAEFEARGLPKEAVRYLPDVMADARKITDDPEQQPIVATAIAVGLHMIANAQAAAAGATPKPAPTMNVEKGGAPSMPGRVTIPPEMRKGFEDWANAFHKGKPITDAIKKEFLEDF